MEYKEEKSEGFYEHDSKVDELDYSPEADSAKSKSPILAYVLTGLLCTALLLSIFIPLIRLTDNKNQSLLKLEDLQLSTNLLPKINLKDADADTVLQLKKLQLVYDFLKDNYYRELSDAEMLEAMYAGLMEKMDSPYTFYLTDDEFSAVQESMSGEYSGIGAQVSEQNGIYLVSDVFDDSPAAKAGVRNGDQFVSINGVPANEFTDVSTLAIEVRGEEGTTVEVEIFRPSDQKEYTFVITRGKVQNANIKFEMLDDEIGYVRIVEFNQGVADNFINALDSLEKKGAKTVIFDVRNNGGGYVHEVNRMLDYLLPEGVLAVAKGRSDGIEFEESWDSYPGIGVPEDWKYVIMINEYSASASELFTGCLRDWEKATIVGEQSFGKGVGSITYPLTDGSALQITNFHYYLPKGDCVQDIGIEPDFEIALPEKLTGLPLGQVPREQDTQLEEAIKHAKTILGKEEKVENDK